MLQKAAINSFEDFYKKGYNKDYPHIELVRLEKLFLDRNKKKTLEYGAGHGANGLHLLKNGYKVTFCDISKNAINLSKKKIDKKYKKNAKFIHLKNMDNKYVSNKSASHWKLRNGSETDATER